MTVIEAIHYLETQGIMITFHWGTFKWKLSNKIVDRYYSSLEVVALAMIRGAR